MEYVERPPHPDLASIVRAYWWLRGDAVRDAAAHGATADPALPDGSPELIINLGAPWEHVARDGKDRAKWEATMTVPMRFNRLILFRPWMWHSFTENFGDSMESGRLIQVFFFEVAGTRPPAAAATVGSRIGA